MFSSVLFGCAFMLNAQVAYDWHHETGDTLAGRPSSIKTICTGDSNCVYVCGDSRGGVDFDYGAPVVLLPDTLHQNGYVAVYDTDGNFLRLWSLELTTNGYCQMTDMCIAVNSDVIVTGYFSGSVDFDPSAGNNIVASGSGGDSYIARYTKYGQLLWARSFTPSSGNWVGAMCVAEEAGKVVVGGSFYSTASSPVDLNPEAGVDPYVASNACAGGFIMSLSQNGTYTWCLGNIGGSVQKIDMNASGTIAVTGQVIIQTDFDPGPGTASHTAVCTGPCMGDFYVARYSLNGSYLWHYAAGNWYEGVGLGVRITATDQVFVVGYCGGLIDLDPGSGSTQINTNGNFGAMYQANGGLGWAWNGGAALEADAFGNAYLMDHNGTHCISPSGNATWSIPVAPEVYGGAVALSQNGKIHLAWETSVTEDVDPGSGIILVNSPNAFSRYMLLSLYFTSSEVNEATTANQTVVYPNPCSDLLTLEATGETSSCTIFDSRGQQVLYTVTAPGQTRIDVSMLPAGIYYLRNGNSAVAVPFVINRE